MICKAVLKQILIHNRRSYLSFIRNISKTHALSHDFNAEGKTTVHVLNNEEDLGLMINGFSEVGFRLNNDITILGPMVIFPRSVLSWNVKTYEDINEKSLCLFSMMNPKPDILVIGIGDRQDDTSFYRRIIPFNKHRISLEVLPTEQACSTFNFLNSEGRYVCGAMIPPQNISTTDDDILATKLRYQELYEIDYK